MPIARCSGIEIEYETFGDRDDAPLMLIMGLGAQMILREGMGHDYPRQVWPQIIDAITRTTKAGRG